MTTKIDAVLNEALNEMFRMREREIAWFTLMWSWSYPKQKEALCAATTKS